MTAFRLGLTGSIGMGKSTTAAMFADEGIPVWDADETVRRLYAPGGGAAAALSAAFPAAIAGDGGVDRAELRRLIAADPAVIDRLNALVHPLVTADRAAFLAASRSDIVLLDIPLLFETAAETQCDAVVVVTAPPEVQRARVLAREGMTEAMFETILARQLPDAEKRARADYLITTATPDAARRQVKTILADIRQGIRQHA